MYLGQYDKDGEGSQEVAVKLVKIDATQADYDEALNEIDIMLSISHANIIKVCTCNAI